MGKNKLNPELMIGDEIMVVSTEGIHDFGAPELFKPYVVIGLKHGTTMNREIHNWTHDEDEEQTPDRSRLGFRKEFDTIPYTYYQIEPIGMTDEERTGAMLAGGGRMKPMYIFPSPSEYRGSDQWILRPGFLRGEHLTEHDQPGLSPELTYGDTILVVDINRERENSKTTYNTPGEEMRPEKYVPYTVVDKESNGHQSKWPFRYTLVPEGQVDEYEKSLDRGWGNYEGYEKLLYPWIYEWIYANTPTASGVDRLTLSEHEESNINPKLKVGDEIIVGGVGNAPRDPMNKPDKYIRYFVTKLYPPNKYQPSNAETYYGLNRPDVDVTDPERPGVYDQSSTHKLLYPADTWMFNPKGPTMRYEDAFEPEVYMSDEELGQLDGWDENDEMIYEHEERKINPELEVDDIIRVVEVEDGFLGEKRPEIFDVYRVVGKGGGGDDGIRQRYHLIKIKGEQRSWSQNRTYTIYNGDTWIKMDNTIKEHQETQISPDLEEGDIIRVIDVDGKHANMPEVWGVYKVVNVGGGGMKKWKMIYDLVSPDLDLETVRTTDSRGVPIFHSKTLYPRDTWIKMDNTIKEHKEELNQRLTMGDVIRVVDVDKDSTYEQPTYDYDTGNASGNSLRGNHRREQIHGQDTYPKPMGIYAVMSKSKYRPKDRDYLNPYWMLWPVDENYKVQSNVKNFREIILTEKDTWMTLKKHSSNIPGDMRKKQKEYDDSGRDIISRLLDEQVEPAFDEFSDAELEKRRTYDDFSDEEKREIDQEHVDMTPFKPMEVKILKTLHKNLDRSELQKLSTDTPEAYGGLDKKFWDIMKLFGIEESNTEQNTRVSRYAKWALDNWTEDGDYGNIEDPIKVPLKWYSVERDESGSQIEYKSGEAEVLGFDEDDAGERADYDFYAWGGEMETNDYGDYESYDSEITNSEFIRMDEGLSRVLREETWDSSGNTIDSSKYQDLLFNFWIKHGPTLDKDRLKLLGFNMDEYEDRGVVWDNLRQYYGDQELKEIIHERLEGLHDSWSYEYIVTSFSVDDTGEVTIDILINGDVMIPISMESGEVIDMSLWDINEKSAEETGGNYYDDVYEEARATVSDDISEVLLKDIPIDMNLDYMDISEPGTFETYVEENELEMITEDDDGYIDDMVYIDEPRDKHIRRMDKDLGDLTGFPIEEFKNLDPPKNESDTTEEEIEQLKSIPVDNDFIESAEKVGKHFQKFLDPNGLEYPKEEIKSLLSGVKAIVLQLKYHYNRPRPWQISDVRGLCLDCDYGDLTSTPSYPSGHATEGRFVARYLADLYPEYKDELIQIGEDIAYSRNMAKVHYPSDSAFGKLLGDSMYDYVNHNQLEPEMVYETIMDDKGDRLKSDIFKILSHTFLLTPTNHSEIKDNEGNYYGIYDIKEEEYVNMSDLIQGVLEFISYGIESGDFKEEDIQKGITAITDWVSLMMNQEKEYVN